jgi:hypothetical protein
MLQPYRCVVLYFVRKAAIAWRRPDIEFNDLRHDARTSATSFELGLRRVPASERLFLSGRQSNFPHRLHVSPITLAHNLPNSPAPGTIGGTPNRNACVTLPTYRARGAWQVAQVSGTAWRFLLSNCSGIGTARGSWIRHQPLPNVMQPAANHNLIVSPAYSAAINIVVTGEPQCGAGRGANVLMALVPNQPYAEGGTPNELAGKSTSYRTRGFIPMITRAAPQLRRVFSTKHI